MVSKSIKLYSFTDTNKNAVISESTNELNDAGNFFYTVFNIIIFI